MAAAHVKHAVAEVCELKKPIKPRTGSCPRSEWVRAALQQVGLHVRPGFPRTVGLKLISHQHQQEHTLPSWSAVLVSLFHLHVLQAVPVTPKGDTHVSSPRKDPLLWL